MKYKQGKFKPNNPKKYKGDINNIYWRSSWELKAMHKFDLSSDVVWWSSEEIAIPYLSPIDNKMHRYFVDMVVCMKCSDKQERIFLIEIKPKSQTKPPERGKKQNRTYIKEVATWGVNKAKWEAAEAYAKSKGYIFQKLTEKELNIK